MKNYVFFDLTGTVFNHRTGRPVPLVPELMSGMASSGWNVGILSSFAADHSRSLLDRAGINLDGAILSSVGASKGAVLEEFVRERPGAEFLFIDDKPVNLASVHKHCGDRVRCIGFVASGKYIPELSSCCAGLGIELALSTVDLCEGLGVGISSFELLAKPSRPWSQDDLFLLVRGLDHPMSAVGGETSEFDHRAVFLALYKQCPVIDYCRLWEHMAWITCTACIWKALVDSVVRFVGLDWDAVLGKAYKDYEYSNALKQFAGTSRQTAQIRAVFEAALETMRLGIDKIGAEAEQCRIARRSIDTERLDVVGERIRDCLG